MSYPTAPGLIQLIDNGEVKDSLTIENEPPLHASETLGAPLCPFNAYSPNGERICLSMFFI